MTGDESAAAVSSTPTEVPGAPPRGGRPRRWRRIVVIVVAALAVALAGGYLAAGASIYNTLAEIKPGCGDVPASQNPANFTVKELDATPYRMPAFQEVTFPSRDAALTIHAFWIPSEAGPSAPAVVVVHGKDSCRRSAKVLLTAGMLHRNGFAALVIDIRNHGDSSRDDGRYAGGIKEYRDVLAAWDWLTGPKGLPASRVGLLGESLGAGIVLIATGEEPRVAATWEDSSYADVGAAIRAELVRNDYPTFIEPGGILMARLIGGVDLTSLSPLKAVAKLNGRPLFITHGTADSRLSVRYAFDLAGEVAVHGGVVVPWIVKGSEHTAAIYDHPAEYERRLADFFRTTIGAG